MQSNCARSVYEFNESYRVPELTNWLDTGNCVAAIYHHNEKRDIKASCYATEVTTGRSDYEVVISHELHLGFRYTLHACTYCLAYIGGIRNHSDCNACLEILQEFGDFLFTHGDTSHRTLDTTIILISKKNKGSHTVVVKLISLWEPYTVIVKSILLLETWLVVVKPIFSFGDAVARRKIDFSFQETPCGDRRLLF